MTIIDHIAHALAFAAEAARMNNRKDLLLNMGLVTAIACSEIPEARRDAALRAFADPRN